MREALFDILESAGVVGEARVLDLYAGTGALGLEALSRGAQSVVFVESDRGALSALRANVADLGVRTQAQVIARDLGAAPTRSAVLAAGPYDLAFADPPWALIDDGEVAPLLGALVASGTFRDGATVVLERSSRSESPLLEGCLHVQDRRYGDTTLAFYKTGILGPPRGDT